MQRGSFGFRIAGAIALIAAGVVAWWLASSSRVRTQPSDRPPASTDQARATQAARAQPRTKDRDSPPLPPVPEAPAGEDAANVDSAPDADEVAAAWAVVDMEKVREAMPDNVYWKLSMPTKDPQVLEWRDQERERWNVEYGKVLSGTGSEDEIRAYYDHRAQVSGDYVEFVSYLLDHYEKDLPERDVGLLKLARRMHLARLEEIPRKIEEAFERKRLQDEARAAWLADEAEFGDRTPDQ